MVSFCGGSSVGWGWPHTQYHTKGRHQTVANRGGPNATHNRKRAGRTPTQQSHHHEGEGEPWALGLGRFWGWGPHHPPPRPAPGVCAYACVCVQHTIVVFFLPCCHSFLSLVTCPHSLSSPLLLRTLSCPARSVYACCSWSRCRIPKRLLMPEGVFCSCSLMKATVGFGTAR